MSKGSNKRNRKKNKGYSFGPETSALEKPIQTNDISSHLSAGRVSVSLLYFQRSCECFSDWQKSELKKFSGTIEKLRSHTVDQLKVKRSLCDIHKNPPKEARFSIPDTLSPDISLYEIKIDPSNKSRMHGFFVGDVYFLLWLDREHACFKS